MTQRSPVNPWLCLSVLLCFLSFAISSAAQDANKTPPTAPQSSAEPGIPPQSPQQKMPDQPDSKGGEAAAVASIASLAIDANKETVKRIEAFYSNTVDIFLRTITIFAVLAGVIGSVAVGHIVKATAKTHAKEIMEPLRRTIEAELRAEFKQVLDALHAEFKEFQVKAMSNLRGLHSAILARAQIISYMENILKAKDDDKIKYESQREEARRLIKELLEKIKPDDVLVLSLTYSVLGLILHF